MISIAKERLVRLSQVPKLLPPRPNGRRVHISAVYRWITRGVGGVRLEAIRIAGSTYTSIEAIERFANHRGEPAQPTSPATLQTTKTRQRQVEPAFPR